MATDTRVPVVVLDSDCEMGGEMGISAVKSNAWMSFNCLKLSCLLWHN